MKTRLSVVLSAINELPAGAAINVEALARKLGHTPNSVRRDLRDLQSAGAFNRPIEDKR